MSKSISKDLRQDVKDLREDVDETLEDVARALRSAAESLADESEEAIAKAAAAVRKAADVLAEKAGKPARAMADRAVQEVKDHPIASAGAALTAAAVLISLLVAERRGKT